MCPGSVAVITESMEDQSEIDKCRNLHRSSSQNVEKERVFCIRSDVKVRENFIGRLTSVLSVGTD